jgi:hypothetical protein
MRTAMGNDTNQPNLIRLQGLLEQAIDEAGALPDDRGIRSLLTRCLIRASPEYLAVRTRLN